MSGFHALSSEEAKKFLSTKGRKHLGFHCMTGKICHWCYCQRCGLIALKNEVTRRALRQPCVTEED